MVASIAKIYVPVHNSLIYDSTAIYVGPGVQLFVCLHVTVLPVPFQLSFLFKIVENIILVFFIESMLKKRMKIENKYGF
jgi:hypothetical protein